MRLILGRSGSGKSFYCMNEIKKYDAMTPEERAQYEKESKQQRYEEKIDIYVDTETGIEYLIYKDYHYGIIGGGNDVIIPRYDEYGNVKTNSTYLELKWLNTLL